MSNIGVRPSEASHEFEYDTTPREAGGKTGCCICGKESRHPIHRTSNESRTVEFVWLCTGAFCSEIYLYDAGRCVECNHQLQKRPAWRRTHETCDQPVAYVPVHPRTGPLWANTVPTLDSERPAHYPVMALYKAHAQKASEQCAPCAEGMNSFTDPDTGKKMHARNGTVTVCAAQKSDDGPHCKACGRGYGLHHDMCPVQPL